MQPNVNTSVNSITCNGSVIYINGNSYSAWHAAAVAESLALQREQVAWQRRQALAAEAQQQQQQLVLQQLAQQQQQQLLLRRLAHQQQQMVEDQRRRNAERCESGLVSGEDAEFDDYAGDAEYREACEIFGRHQAPRLVASSEGPNAYLALSQVDAAKVAHLYQALGWTQARLALLLECSQTKVSKLLAELGIRR